jgi:hypothetical protein
MMEKDTVLSLSPSVDVLASREATLRNGGLKVISVLSPIQARFEIEMGRCGVLLICYRLSSEHAAELSTLFRRNCPEGRIIFVTEPAHKVDIPADADFAVPESSGPELILRLLKESGRFRSSQTAA